MTWSFYDRRRAFPQSVPTFDPDAVDEFVVTSEGAEFTIEFIEMADGGGVMLCVRAFTDALAAPGFADLAELLGRFEHRPETQDEIRRALVDAGLKDRTEQLSRHSGRRERCPACGRVEESCDPEDL